MQNKFRISLIALIMVVTIVATIFISQSCNLYYENQINLSDFFGLLVNGILAYYLGTTFVRSNDKKKSIREYFIKEMFSLMDEAKNNFVEIRGIENDFINSSTIEIIQNLRDKIEYLNLLNVNLFQKNKDVAEKLGSISTKIAELDLIVNSGYGIHESLLLESKKILYNNLVMDINNDFASIFRIAS